LCFCPIYGTLCTIPFLLSACITKALLFKHGKETYIYDKGQLLWKSYFSRINTAHWHKLKTTNKHDYNSHQTNLLILLPCQAKPSQAKPTSSTLQCQNQPGIIWQACRQFACIFCNVDLYIQSDTAAGKENILNESNLPWYSHLYRSNSLCNRLCGIWISFPV